MEMLGLLEKKLAELVEHAKRLKEQNDELRKQFEQLAQENARLIQDNALLQGRIEVLELSLLKDKEELSQEKELTKMVVDGLIKSIDSLVEQEQV